MHDVHTDDRWATIVEELDHDQVIADAARRITDLVYKENTHRMFSMQQRMSRAGVVDFLQSELETFRECLGERKPDRWKEIVGLENEELYRTIVKPLALLHLHR